MKLNYGTKSLVAKEFGIFLTLDVFLHLSEK